MASRKEFFLTMLMSVAIGFGVSLITVKAKSPTPSGKVSENVEKECKPVPCVRDTVTEQVEKVVYLPTADSERVFSEKRTLSKSTEFEIDYLTYDYPVYGKKKLLDSLQKAVLELLSPGRPQKSIEEFETSFMYVEEIDCSKYSSDSDDLPWQCYPDEGLPKSFDSTVVYLREYQNVITVYDSAYEYGSGAAHGNLYYNAMSVIKKNNQVVRSYKDLFQADSAEISKYISQFVNRITRVGYDYATCISETQLPISNRPFIEDSYVVFNWGAYEIACGADQIVYLKIEIEKLKPYLKPKIYDMIK